MKLLETISEEVKNGQVTEYSDIDAALNELRDKYGNEVPDASTKDGYQRAKDIAKETTSLRSAIESRRKGFKAPVLSLGKMIDSEAKRITAALLEIETPFKSAYRAVDEAKKQRKLDIENRIIEIRDLPNIALQSDSAAIETMIGDLAELDVSKETFGRRDEEAAALVASTLEKLSEIHAAQIEKEAEEIRIEAERAELEALRKEKEERERKAAEEEANQIRAEHEKMIAEQARIEAEKAAASREARLLQEAKEAEERRKIEAEQAEQRRIEAEAKAKSDAEEAAERARQAEIARQQAEADRIQREKEQREANKRHVGSIRKAAKESLMALGIDEEKSKEIVLAIHNGKVANVSIQY